MSLQYHLFTLLILKIFQPFVQFKGLWRRSISVVRANTHSQTRSHTHTHSHPHPLTSLHTQTHSHTHTHTHTHTLTHSHTLSCTHIHPQTYTYTHTDTHTHINPHTHTHTHSHTITYTSRTHLHTYTDIHTHIHPYTHELNFLLSFPKEEKFIPEQRCLGESWGPQAVQRSRPGPLEPRAQACQCPASELSRISTVPTGQCPGLRPPSVQGRREPACPASPGSCQTFQNSPRSSAWHSGLPPPSSGLPPRPQERVRSPSGHQQMLESLH